MKKVLMLAAGLLAAPASAWSAVYMDAEWAKEMCSTWNTSPELTTELAGDNWMGNNGERGYKIIRLYRDKCGPETAVQLTISAQDGKSMCTYGGAPTAEEMDPSMDYLMYATDEDWMCMGQAKFGCGAMGAMMTGKLKFKGPKMEAMGVMGPFNAFLQMADDVPGDQSQCP